VTLPSSEIVDNAHIGTVCTKVQFAEGQTPGEKCPAGSLIGSAKATTPLLEKPLEGPVYLRSSTHKLPDVVAALHGQIEIDLDGHVDSVTGGLRTTFETVPDAPVSSFTLNLDGGQQGLLQNTKPLCKTTPSATEELAGQNGRTANATVAIATPCHHKPSKRHKRHSHRKHRRRHRARKVG
jgi:hypothetical protein